MPFPPSEIGFAKFKLPTERVFSDKCFKRYHNGVELRGCGVDAIYKFAANRNYELLDNASSMQCSLEMPDGKRVELQPLKYLKNINEWAGCDAQLEGLN